MTKEEHQDWQLETAWKILEANTGFSKHFDFKTAGLLTIAGALVVAVGDRLKSLKTLPIGDFDWLQALQLGLIAVFSLAIFIVFLYIVSAVSPTGSASFVGLLPRKHGQADNTYRGVIYFGDIARLIKETETTPDARRKIRLDNWHEHLAAADKERLYRDLSDQIAENALIAEDKANRLRVASTWLLVALAAAGLLLLGIPILQTVCPGVPEIFK